MKVLFMGRKQVAADTLKTIAAMPNVEIVGVLTDSHLENSPTAEFARAEGLEVLDFDDALRRMKNGEMDFDFGVSVLYWRRLKEEFLTIPRLGVINFHPAPLPEYKGVAGYNLAILEGRTRWAVSAHYVDEKIDSGAIIEVLDFAIDPDSMLCTTLEKKSMQALRDLIDKTLHRVFASNALLESFPNVGGRYVSRNEMEEMKKIMPGDDVERKVRAFWFPPYEGAYVEMDGKRFTLVSHDVLKSLSPSGTTSLFSSEA
ncbi:MAG: methionyl-tRNA formyltransferase [Comamonas sp.]